MSKFEYISPKEYASRYGLAYQTVMKHCREHRYDEECQRRFGEGVIPSHEGHQWRIPDYCQDCEPQSEAGNEVQALKNKFLGVCLQQASEILLNPDAELTEFQKQIVKAFGDKKLQV